MTISQRTLGSRFWAVTLGLFCGYLSACRSGQSAESQHSLTVGSPPANDPSDRYAAKPWTSAFEERSVLLADEVRLEGPQGLLDHLYLDGTAKHEQKAQTLPEGFMQSVLVRTGSNERIRAQIDGMRIEAIRSLTVFEKIAPCAVSVKASGDVWWKSVNGAEVRGETWEKSGKIGE